MMREVALPGLIALAALVLARTLFGFEVRARRRDRLGRRSTHRAQQTGGLTTAARLP